MATLSIKDSAGDTKYLNVVGEGTPSEPYQSVVPSYGVAHAINQIFQDDAVTVSVAEKGKSLIKFGVNSAIQSGVSETVWMVGGNETYPTGNDIDIVTSTSGSDTQDVVIEGHTLSGSDLTFVTQTATLNGTSDVTLTTPLYRANRMYNNNSADFVGTVTVEDNGTSVHLQAATGNQSLKCATSTSSVDYWIITGIEGSVERSTSAVVDFELQVREYGKVFRTRFFFTSDQSGRYIPLSDTPIIVKPNSDIRMIATSNTNSTEVSASIIGYLAIIT